MGIWEEKVLILEAAQIDNALSEKMKRQIMKAIVQRFATLDTDIDDGDTEPAFDGAESQYDVDRGLVRVRVGERVFDIRVGVAMR